jgi:asparagine synthase (glutamine-hydrolysing)
MRDTMTHRGPDDEGVYLAPGVGLGHRRLSIIDLSGGRQPMANADESLWVTFNGEIYNFRELRTLLEAKGYVFRTKSDTEVILHAYAEFGERCVEHFRGMFTFGLWDQRRRLLLLARDRVGIKPLYYALVGEIASEIKALLAWPGMPREVDETSLGAYLRYRYVPGPRTMFRGVSKLQPGHVLIVRDGAVSDRQYWDVPLGEEVSEPGSTRRLLELLEESVKLRLISDVPLGVFLSGGLDSSAVVATMTASADQTIQTFSVGYPDGPPAWRPFSNSTGWSPCASRPSIARSPSSRTPSGARSPGSSGTSTSPSPTRPPYRSFSCPGSRASS